IYTQLVNDTSMDRALRANALMHIGICYEKLGKKNAQNVYQRVITEYPEQTELTAMARKKLELLQPSQVNSGEINKGLNIINLYEEGSSLKKRTRLDNSCISPDGTKMVGMDYSMIGQNVAVYDLKTKNIELVTKYKWLSKSDGWTYFPIWSPDGKEVAYMFSGWKGGYELQVSPLKREIRTLIKNENGGQIIPRQWSQDGSNILTFKEDSTGIYTIGLVSVKSGLFNPLHKTQWKGEMMKGIKGDASLSPDGKFIVLSDGSEENFDLYIMDANGGTPTLLFEHPTNEIDPLWSPDGRYIVFIRKTKGESFLYAVEMKEGKPVGQPFIVKEGMQNIDLVNWTASGINYRLMLDIHDIHTLTLDPEKGTPKGKPKILDYTPTGSNVSPVWSYDGNYLAFISYDNKPEIVILSENNREIKRFPIEAPRFSEFIFHDLRWVPDGSGLSLNVMSPEDRSIIHHLDITTGNWQEWPLPLPANERGRTEWGPDKNSFLYTNKKEGIIQYNIKTGENRTIFKSKDTTWAVIQRLRLSRDLNKLAFHNIFSDEGIIVLGLNSGESRKLGENFRDPIFSPDGKKILARHVKGKKTIGMVVLNLEGKILNKYNLKKYFSKGTSVSARDWSPDGKQLILKTRNSKLETYLMKNVLK
ncbi:MAG: hypothetical protein ABFS12_14795, partial [Bacteroidota bacterium]